MKNVQDNFGSYKQEKKKDSKTEFMEIFVNKGNKPKRDGKIFSNDSTVF